MSLESPYALAEKLIREGVASKETIVGCSDEEIHELANEFKFELPSSFKEFLKVMGKEKGCFFEECDFSFPFSGSSRRIAGKLLSHAGKTLPVTAFVFLERYGSAAAYFDTADGADPPVYIVQEWQEPKKVSDTFLEWLNLAVNDAVRDYKDMLRARTELEEARKAD